MPPRKITSLISPLPKEGFVRLPQVLAVIPVSRLSSGKKESKPESTPPPSNLAPEQPHGAWKIFVDSLNASQRKRAISDEPYARYASRPSIRYSTTYCTHNGSVYQHAPAGTRIPSPSSYSRSGYRYPLRSPRHRKTFTALSAALAVAGGATLFHWHAPNPKQVLYVDGEMPAQAMQDRLISLARGTDATEEAIRNLSIITPDMQNRPMPDLSTPAGQYALEPFLDNVRLLVLDNLSTLCRSGKENEAQSWQPIQSWLLDLRRRGISVLLVHHAGKSGDQARHLPVKTSWIPSSACAAR